MSNPLKLNIILEFGGGAELLVKNKAPFHNIDLPINSQHNVWTLGCLLNWIRDNILSERPELFLKGESVRPGILVLINDADWELFGQLDYRLHLVGLLFFLTLLYWFLKMQFASNVFERLSITSQNIGHASDVEKAEEADEETFANNNGDVFPVDVDKDSDRCASPAFVAPRHTETMEGYVANTFKGILGWRLRDRMKTVSVALVVCLNVGVDPPDLIRTSPCARMECWQDPFAQNPNKALDTIGSHLQRQYERWQPRARYKKSLDPTMEEVRRLVTSLRRGARGDRVLFHYNGHGVPRPTANGEIWVFNQRFTQYIPMSIYDLQMWISSPSIFVFDCSNSAIIVESFKAFAHQHAKEHAEKMLNNPHCHSPTPSVSASDDLSMMPPLLSSSSTTPIVLSDCILLAACAADQLLPTHPSLPADLFTSCLTTPIKIALRWFINRNTHPFNRVVPNVTLEMLDKIPGQFGDRRTMLGELNWIFTAITDTIAWNSLPHELFQKLFRQDLLVASLFRNFLLAQRLMYYSDCFPVSYPALPATHLHRMWNAWDYAVHTALSQLPLVLKNGPSAYIPTAFFEDQLTAFQVWLNMEGPSSTQKPAEHLPIVLQVLLSQAHRMRALELLAQFLDLGSRYVHQALSVGIFPYTLKLLQSSAPELRPLLVFIWVKILTVDPLCRVDLFRDNCHHYFLSILEDPRMPMQQRTWAAFILATVMDKYRTGQTELERGNLITICIEIFDDADANLRQWLTIALGRLWQNNESAKWRGVRCNVQEKLFELLEDSQPEVRAAAVFALGTFLSTNHHSLTEHAALLDRTIIQQMLLLVSQDASSLVRQELIIAFRRFVATFDCQIVSDDLEDSSLLNQRGSSMSCVSLLQSDGPRTIMFNRVYNWLLLSVKDPLPVIARMSNNLLKFMRRQGRPAAEDDDGNSILTSSFLEWSANQFTKPLLKHVCDNCFCDLHSWSHWRHKWLQSRNRSIIESPSSHTEAERIIKRKGNIDQIWGILKFSSSKEIVASLGSASVIAFHPFKDEVAIGGNNYVDIWTTRPVPRFIYSINNLRVASLVYINAMFDDSLLLVTTIDGSIKVFTTSECHLKYSLINAWQAAPLNSETVATVWHQESQTVVLGGKDTAYLRVWDVRSEILLRDLTDHINISSLAITNNESPFLLSAGFVNGTVSIFDIRSCNSAAIIKQSYRIETPIIDVRFYSSFLYVGDADGQIRHFDIRKMDREPTTTSTLFSTVGRRPTPISLMRINPNFSLVAAASKPVTSTGPVTCTGVYNLRSGNSSHNELLHYVKPHSGLFSLNRIRSLATPTGIEFHPYLLQLAVAFNDGNVALYSYRANSTSLSNIYL